MDNDSGITPDAPPAGGPVTGSAPAAGARGGFTDTQPRSAAPVPTGHPPALLFFFWGEFAERSSYYGMRAILFMYMTEALGLSDTTAGPWYSAFKMACYFLPLLGGLIADRFLGRYWTIVGFSIPYVAGHFILGIPHTVALLSALALLAGGSGVIKPNISTLLGQTYDQMRPGMERLRAAAFNWFYLSINVGALISMLALPLVRDHYITKSIPAEGREAALEAVAKGEKKLSSFAQPEDVQHAYAVAFAFPAWLMVLSLGVFAAGKRFYAVETQEAPNPYAVEDAALKWKTLAQLFGIFALIVVYWIGYEHNDTLWVAFTRDYVNLNVSVPFTSKSFTLAPDQLQFINALFVIILIPTFNFGFGWLDPQTKVFTPMRKILAGFLLTAVAVGMMSAAGFFAQGYATNVEQGGKLVGQMATGDKVSVLWPALSYVVLTFGEVLLYGTMLELAYSAAPKSMKGFVTACFLVTSALGNFINMAWTPMYGGSLTDEVAKRGPLLPGQFFGLTALLTFAAAGAFVFVGRQFEKGQAEAKAAGVS